MPQAFGLVGPPAEETTICLGRQAESPIDASIPPFKALRRQRFQTQIQLGGPLVDGASIFVYVLSATFFGLIVYLAVLSRSHDVEGVKPEGKKPRNVA